MLERLAWVAIAVLVLTSSAVAQVKWQIGKPIVTYYAGPDMTDATAQQMAAGNFNVVWCSEKQLDTVHKHGLRGMLRDGLLNPAVLEDAGKRAQLDALIERVKGHPALYSYYLIDEPNASRFPEFGKLVAYLREKDPARMAYINLFPTYASNEQLGNKGDVVTAYREHLQQFVDIVKPDLISYDHYHFTANGDSKQYFLNLGLIREAALRAGVPFLNIVQACSWHPSMRIPHTNEVRWLVNTSLAYGAQGISYYVYAHPGHLGALATLDGQPTPLYYGLKSVNHDFAAMAAELQPLTSLGAYHANVAELPLGATALPANAPLRVGADVADAPLLIGAFGPRGGAATHFVVVNLDYGKPLQTSLTADAPLTGLNPATGRWSALRGPKLRLEAGGAKLLRIAR
ncbi:hypothetical protein LLH23_12880 [bacterium]|nr:hypothetical protein [bacterium]